MRTSQSAFAVVLAFSRLFSSRAMPVVPVPVAYQNPTAGGGSQLDSSAGLGEPLNIIISGLSSASVLTTSGIENWARSINFSTECLGFHIGVSQTANLGDGQGDQKEIAVMRGDYDSSSMGTCLESLTGGNHFRFWRQANSGAYFLAASVEENAFENHMIQANGYDEGRDNIVKAANGTTSYGGTTYKTGVDYVDGLLTAGSSGINHGISIDGKVALLTIYTL